MRSETMRASFVVLLALLCQTAACGGFSATPAVVTVSQMRSSLSRSRRQQPLHTVVRLRGGQATLFDMARVKTRLEGLSAYSVISTLMLNVSLRLFTSTSTKLEYGRTLENVIKVVFCGSVVLAIMTGMYTTVVFTLLGLYSKAAIGMGYDQQYLDFFAATARIRSLAFDAFLVSLVSFEVSFLGAVFLQFKGKVRRWASVGASVAMLWSFWHWYQIMHLATTLLFSSNG